MRLSRYLKSAAVDPGVVGVYSPFGHEFTFLPRRDWDALEAGDWGILPPAVLHDLRRRRFLVEEGFEDHILDEYRPGDEAIREMWLIMAQGCNMACQYCVVEGNVADPKRRAVGGHHAATAHDRPAATAPAKPALPTLPVLGQAPTPTAAAPSAAGGRAEAGRDMMSPEVAEAAVAKFERYLQESRPPFPRVTLYGGEPLLNPRTIRHVVPLIRRITFPGANRPEPVQILVITNGQIYNEGLTALFRENRVSVSVSLDGMRHHHDAQRVTHDGAGTFDKAVASLRRYQAAGLQVGICTTIGTHNAEDLPEIAAFFADEFAVPVEFQVPFNIPYAGGNQSYLPMVQAAPKAMRAYEILRERGLLEGLAGRRLTQIAQGIFHHRDCSAVGGQWVVAPDGMIGPCHSLVGERVNFGGDVRDDACHPQNQPQFREWWRRMPINMPDSHGCPAIAICGGGCPYNALIHRGSIWAKDPQQCDYMDFMLEWLIKDMWDRYRHRWPGADPRTPSPSCRRRPGEGRPRSPSAEEVP